MYLRVLLLREGKGGGTEVGEGKREEGVTGKGKGMEFPHLVSPTLTTVCIGLNRGVSWAFCFIM